MPLTKSGKRIKAGFEKQYGSKGESVFYATMNSKRKGTTKWEKQKLGPKKKK